MGAVSKEIYEAAAIDGATPWQADRYITLPLMRNVCGTSAFLQELPPCVEKKERNYPYV